MLVLIKKRNGVETIPLFERKPDKASLEASSGKTYSDEEVEALGELFDTYKDFKIKVKHLGRSWWLQWTNEQNRLVAQIKAQHKNEGRPEPTKLEVEAFCEDHWRELLREPFVGLEGVMFSNLETGVDYDPNTVPREELIEDLQSLGLFELIGQRILAASVPNAEIKKNSVQSSSSKKKRSGPTS